MTTKIEQLNSWGDMGQALLGQAEPQSTIPPIFIAKRLTAQPPPSRSHSLDKKPGDLALKAEVLRWPATTMHYRIGVGWHVQGVALSIGGVAYPWGRFNFSPYLVDGGGIHGGGS